MFLARTFRMVNGQKYMWWVLKKAIWDKETKRQRQVYLAYVGPKRTITQTKARGIASKLGISLEELKKVRRLKIVP